MAAMLRDLIYGFGIPNVHHTNYPAAKTNIPSTLLRAEGNIDNPIYSIALAGPQVGGWTFTVPMIVQVEHANDGTYIVADDLFLVYGVGHSAREAIDDYVISLAEYHDILALHAGQNPEDYSNLDRLRVYLSAPTITLSAANATELQYANAVRS